MDSHVYERHFSQALGTAFEIPEGVREICFPIDFPGAGIVTKLIVLQSDGTPTGFTVNLLNRQICDPTGSESSPSPGPGVELWPPLELAKILPTVNRLAGEVMETFNPHGFRYRNMEGNFSNPVRRIYLLLTLPEALSGPTAWDVAIGGEPRI